MKTFKFRGKKYRWNPKKSPLYIPVTLLLFVTGLVGFMLLGAAMCSCEPM